MIYKPYKHLVQYYETDQMGIVHHSNYIRWFEEARSFLLEENGFGYKKMEESGIISPVLSVNARYKSMTHYYDTVIINVKVVKYNGVKITLEYTVIDEKTGEAKVWYETSQYLDNVEAIPSERLNVGSVEVFKRFDGEIRNLPTANDLLTGRTDYPLFKQVGKLKSNSNRTITDIMYNNRDKRMDATIIRDMSEFWGLTMTLNLGGNASQGIRSKEDGGWYTTTTGYYWRKNMVKPDPRAFVSVKINFHYIIARLGEMYMNLAEAYLLKGDVAKAVEMLNVTRMKHGGLPASKASTLDDAWTDYMRERRVEMAYENGDIYFSYLRWGKYGGACNYGRASGDVIKDLNSPVYKIGISSDRKSFCVGQLTLLNSWNRNFTTRRYLFPIPQGAIDKRAADGIVDKQNEGW